MGRVIFIILNLFFIIAILVSFWKDEQVEINKINQAYNDDIKILEENIKVLEEEKKELNEENSILSNKYNELLEKYDNAQKELEEKDRVIEELKSSIDLDSLGIDTGKKTYMDYRAISSKNSSQYKLQYSGNITTDEDGMRVYTKDRVNYYCAAVGTGFGMSVGDLATVYCENGNIFNIIVGDIKSDSHTDSNHIYTVKSGCMLEFIVDISELDAGIKRSGNIGNMNKFSGNIVGIVQV